MRLSLLLGLCSTSNLNRVGSDRIRTGDLCLVRDPEDDCFKRARVTSVNSTLYKAQVDLIDEGLDLGIDSGSAFSLPENVSLKNFPQYSFEIILIGLQPYGKTKFLKS